MKFILKPDPKVGDERIITRFIFCRTIKLELRVLEICKIKQIFAEYDYYPEVYNTRFWEDVDWVKY